jgi:hypothetical protein
MLKGRGTIDVGGRKEICVVQHLCSTTKEENYYLGEYESLE